MILLALIAASVLANPIGGHAIVRADSIVRDSIVRDSIYSLAVNPADYPKESTILLLDEGVYRIEPDGRGSRVIRQVIQILKPEGAYQYREQRLSFNPEHQRLIVNWMRVVRPSGVVISDHPEQVQESDVPAPMGTPMYTSTKVWRLSLSGLDSGTVFDYSITTEELKPPMPGDFFYSWRVNPPVPVRRSLLVVDVPAGFSPRIKETNLSFRRTERTVAGRTIYKWATDNVTAPKFEMFAPDSSLKVMSVGITPPFGWSAIGDWYAPVVAPRYAITPVVAERIRKVVASAKTLEDSLRAIHKWVSSDVRYVAILLGQGGYVPRDAETVTRTGFGDCKDKTMLFLAALRSIGVTGYPVLLNATAKVDEAAPSVGAFNHMIAAVKIGNGYRYSDLTVGDIAFGELPPGEAGKFGLLVGEGVSGELHLPGDSASAIRREDLRISGTVTADGMFNGVMEETVTGGNAGFFKAMIAHPPDSAMRSSFARSLAATMFDGADGDSLTFRAAPDSSDGAVIRVLIRNGRATTEVSNLELLTNPIHPFTTPARIQAELEKAPARTLPFDLAKIGPSITSHDEVVLRLPDGWHAMLPNNVSYAGLLGTLDLTFSQVGNELRIARNSVGVKGVVGPDKLNDVLAALKQLKTDNTRTIPIQR